jgi:hypothetical protein
MSNEMNISESLLVEILHYLRDEAMMGDYADLATRLSNALDDEIQAERRKKRGTGWIGEIY